MNATTKNPEVADVPGAVDLKIVDEDLPCGIGRQTTWRDAAGVVLRQDYAVLVREGFVVDGVSELS